MRMKASKEFNVLAKQVAQTGKAHGLTVRQLLAHFGQERRGSEVCRFIRYKLRYLGVTTEPAFDEVPLEQTIQVVRRAEEVKPPPPKPAKPGTVMAKSPSVVPVAAPVAALPPEAAPVAAEEQLPYLPVSLLQCANRPPVRVKRDDSFKTVMSQLLLHRISHLPVMSNDRTVEGMITWASIGRRLGAGKTPVSARQCMESNCRVVSGRAPLLDVVREVLEHGVVLVQAADKTICGLVTAKDAAEQFVARAEPFLFLEQIEGHLRHLLQRAKLTADELRELVDPGDAKRKLTAAKVADLSVGEIVRALGEPQYWDRLKLGLERALFAERMEAIRSIRNAVMHFHPDGLSAKQQEALAKTREMLQGL